MNDIENFEIFSTNGPVLYQAHEIVDHSLPNPSIRHKVENVENEASYSKKMIFRKVFSYNADQYEFEANFFVRYTVIH